MAKKAATRSKQTTADGPDSQDSGGMSLLSSAGLATDARGAGKSRGDASAEDPSGQVRPAPTFDSIIGQQRAIGTLKAAMACGRVHHAWIFSGPAGVGKRTTAVAFAGMLLDPTTEPDLGGELRPDPESQTQRLISLGSHPDLHMVSKELAAFSAEDTVRRSKQTSIAKEVVQEFLVEPAQRARVMHSKTAIGKVFVVEEAELLNDASQNALLKTVEEPPEGTLLILITSSEERLLTTIRSRCQRVEFRALDSEEMVEWIRGSGLELPPMQFDWLVRASAGSPGEAKLAAERGLFKWEEQIGPALDGAVRGKFSIGLASAMSALIEEQAAEEVRLNSHASKDGANKVWARRMLMFVGERLRRSLREHARLINGGVRADGVALSDDPKAARLLHMIQAVSEADRHFASNVSMVLALENFAGQLVAEAEPVV